MAPPADKVSKEPADPNALTGDTLTPIGPHGNALQKFLRSHWIDQAARTTAILAVTAAVASSQYALQISRAILAQAEATDEWNHYSAKSIKRHLTVNQNESLSALALANPHLKEQLGPLISETESEG